MPPMKRATLAGFLCLFLSGSAFAYGSRGFCAPMPGVDKHHLPPPTTENSVVLQLVVSDKGYVCSEKVARGASKDLDNAALDAVKKWQFKPAQKDGHAVSVFILVEVKFAEKPDGTLVVQSQPPK